MDKAKRLSKTQSLQEVKLKKIFRKKLKNSRMQELSILYLENLQREELIWKMTMILKSLL